MISTHRTKLTEPAVPHRGGHLGVQEPRPQRQVRQRAGLVPWRRTHPIAGDRRQVFDEVQTRQLCRDGKINRHQLVIKFLQMMLRPLVPDETRIVTSGGAATKQNMYRSTGAPGSPGNRVRFSVQMYSDHEVYLDVANDRSKFK